MNYAYFWRLYKKGYMQVLETNFNNWKKVTNLAKKRKIL